MTTERDEWWWWTVYTARGERRFGGVRRGIIALVWLALITVGFGWLGKAGLTRGWFDAMDRWMELSQASAANVEFFELVAEVAATKGFIILTLLMVAVLLLRRLIWPGVVFFSSAVTAVIAQSVLKDWVARMRPGDLAMMESGSFPSGQAFLSVAVYGLFAVLLSRSLRSVWAKILVGAVTLCLLTLISYGRLVLGAHYVSDVVAGNLLGLIWLGTALWTAHRPKRKVYDFS